MGRKQIYSGGTILTMESEGTVQAVFVEDGIIRAVGTKEQMQEIAGTGTEEIFLNGHTMLPAFLDAHSHITALASTLSLASLEGAADFSEIISRLKSFANKGESSVENGLWALAMIKIHFGNILTQLRKSLTMHLQIPR